jgi:hypothetical protein
MSLSGRSEGAIRGHPEALAAFRRLLVLLGAE